MKEHVGMWHAYETERNAVQLRIARRPVCRYCGRPLKPFYHITGYRKVDDGNGEIIMRRFDGQYGYEGGGEYCGIRHKKWSQAGKVYQPPADERPDLYEGYLADSYFGPFDDDPSPYEGNYSEE